jgi:hypothetical protein
MIMREGIVKKNKLVLEKVMLQRALEGTKSTKNINK